MTSEEGSALGHLHGTVGRRFGGVGVAALAVGALVLTSCGSGSISRPVITRPSTTTSAPATSPPTDGAPLPPPPEVSTTTDPLTTTTIGTTPSTTVPSTTTSEPSTPTTDAPTTTIPPTVPPTDSPGGTTTSTTGVVAPPPPPPGDGTDALAPVDSDSDSSTPWGWIIAGVVAVGAAIAGIVIAARKRGAQQQRRSSWRLQAAAVAGTVRMLSTVIAGGSAQPIRATPAEAAAEIEQSAASLEQLAADAPDDETRALARTGAEQLRGLGFAIEAERILRESPTPPSSEQLQAADADRRARSAALETVLTQLEQA